MAVQGKGFELAAAYVTIMPSMRDATRNLEAELNGINPNFSQMENNLNNTIGKAAKGVNKAMSKGLLGASKAIGAPIASALVGSIKGVGNLLGNTLAAGAKTGGLAITAALGAISTQIIGGGFDRALSLNKSEAGLKAMGYQGQEFEKIMKAASDAVDGTAYSMDKSVAAARGFLSAGVPEEKLKGYLDNVGKLADMGTRSYDEIGVMMQSMAATGIVQGGDMLQLAQAGVPIFAAMAEHLGVSVTEVKKLGAEGKISFNDMQDAITKIPWDSALFASTSVTASFANMRTALSKTGANIWKPIIEGLPKILNNMKTFISVFNKTFDFNPIQIKLSSAMTKINSIFDFAFKDDGSLDGDILENFYKGIIDQTKLFLEKIDAYKPIIAGALIGMLGGLLGGLPLIGPLFAGITPLVGAFAGTLVAAYNNSDKLKSSVDSLGTWFTDLFKKFKEGSKDFKPEELFKQIGDGLADGLNFVKDFIGDFAGRIGENLPQISESIEKMFNGIGDVFEGISARGFDGAALADIFTDVIDFLAEFIPIAVGLVDTAAEVVGDFVSSAGFKNFIKVLTEILKYVADNKEVLMIGIAAAGAVFIGSKVLSTLFAAGRMLAIFGGLSRFLGFLNGPSGRTIANAPAAGKTFANSMKAMGKFMLKAGLWIAAIVAVIVGIGALVEHTDFERYVGAFITDLGEQMTRVADSIGGILDVYLPTVERFADAIKGTVGGVLTAIMNSVLDPVKLFIQDMVPVIEDLGGVGEGLINALSGFILSGAVYTSELTDFLQTLAIFGKAAGVGALAAAGGVSALMLAIAGGSVITGGIGLVDRMFGGKGNPLGDLATIVSELGRLATLTADYPMLFASVLTHGMNFGLQLPVMIAQGISTNAPAIKNSLSMALASAISNQQAYLNSNPLIVKMKVDESSLRAVRSLDTRSTSGSGGSVTNNTRNYNVRTSNDSIIKNLLKGEGAY